MAEQLTKPVGMENGLTAKSITEAERPKTKPVVQGKVSVKKQPAGERLRESLGLEKTRTVGDYLVWDVLIPAAKEMVADLVKKGIDVFLYGGASAVSDRARRGGRSSVSYDGYYSQRNNYNRRYEVIDDRKRYRYQGRNVDDFRDFIFDDRRDAEMVLSELCESVDVYGFAKVSDFYSLVGETERNFTDHGYGWDSLGTASVERTRDGWVVNLPRPIPLN